MKHLEGFIDPPRPHHVCKLTDVIYALKQSPRSWYVKLRTTLLQWWFINTRCDSAFFIHPQYRDMCMKKRIYTTSEIK
ncbi:putative RNA-directed DNA polymerase [Lupinus albus]|uniref:Putative RNA-directed DNA polymerase n=1 Tax=Lupinus albus TaxID=3870 RepID=A0A6A4NPX0_LUPAL|nr:putative RNA-directed DNA polymerase [Lupinus albus]